MPARTTLRIRTAIIAVFSLLMLALVLPSVSAQLRPPSRPSFPQPPITQPPRPGFSGAGGSGNIPGTGNFTGNRPGGTMFENVWTCGKCGKEIAKGNYPPATCQFCGVKLVNGIGGGDRPIGSGGNPGFPDATPNFPNTPNPGFPNANNPGMLPAGGDGNFPTPTPPTTPSGPQYNPPAYTPPSPSAPTSTTTTESGPSPLRLLVMVGAVVGGIMFLLVIVIAVVAISSRMGGKKPKRAVRRRRPTRDFDDDDD